MKSYSFRPGQVLVSPEMPLLYIYRVEKGFVRQYAVSSGGEELTVFIYPTGSLFFISWLEGVTKNEYYFEAVSRVSVTRMGLEQMQIQMRQDRGIAEELMRAGYMGLTLLMTHMKSMIYGNALSKIASVLSMLAKWYGQKEVLGLRISMPLTHQLLATMVGMTRETTSAALSDLKKQKYIFQRGKNIYVTKVEELAELAGISQDIFPDLVL